MGLAEVLSRRDRAGESCRQPNGRQNAVLGGDGASVRLRFRGRVVSESTSGIWMDERNLARHAVAAVDDFHQRDAQLATKKPLGDPAPSGESQEVSSVIGVAMNAALQNNLNDSDGFTKQEVANWSALGRIGNRSPTQFNLAK